MEESRQHIREIVEFIKGKGEELQKAVVAPSGQVDRWDGEAGK
jgi:hypothetical protein